jgi:hypothetical protein
MRACVLFVWAVVSLLGCLGKTEPDDVGSLPAAIVGGQVTPPCAFATTVAYVGGSAKCTATLIHPKMIVLAAHCVDGIAPIEITFGDISRFSSDARRRVPIEACRMKRGDADDQGDLAYCILGQEVNDIPIVPILYGCEARFLKPNTTAVAVGFGYVNENTPSPSGAKRSVSVKVDAVEEKAVVIGDSTHGACFGDSGGPALVTLPDGTWRVFGMIIGGAGATSGCSEPTECAFMPHYVPWLEQDSGLDITPCYDTDGTWHPDERCKGFPMNPEESTGTWEKMCTESLILSGPGAACSEVTDVAAPDARQDSSVPIDDAPLDEGGMSPSDEIETGPASSETTDARSAEISEPEARIRSTSAGCSCRVRQCARDDRCAYTALSIGAAILVHSRRARFRERASLRMRARVTSLLK